MLSRLLPLLFAAAVFAEAPRPRPGFEGVGVPGLSGYAFGMCQDFDSWWGNWSGIEVIASMELFPG